MIGICNQSEVDDFIARAMDEIGDEAVFSPSQIHLLRKAFACVLGAIHAANEQGNKQ